MPPSPAKKAQATKPKDQPRSRIIRAVAPPKPVAVKTPAKMHRSSCPINLVLEMIGDSWSLLIVRDMMLRGHTGYQAFLRSEEKIATNILADRLSKLEQNGLISKSPDPSDARKFIYALTAKGADLAPLLVEMTLYSLKHAPRIDMPKDIVSEMQRNKSAFGARLARSAAPKVKRPRIAREKFEDPADETLSLF